jgi:TIR domain/YEATS family
MSAAIYRIEQDFQYVGNDYWKWWAWIAADDADLDEVKKVVWLLHPSFARSRITVEDRASHFQLNTAGWGTFLLRAELHLKNGDKLPLRRNLRLAYPIPSAREAAASSPSTASASGDKPKSVFLSYSSLDARIAAQLREHMTRAGLQVLDQTQLSPDEPWRETLMGMITKSDAVVSLIGDQDVSPIVGSEMGFAVASSKPTLALLTASAGDVKLPQEVQVERLDPSGFDAGLISRLMERSSNE